ncbi:MAG: phospholipase D-like domain-containing protein [Burkholderiaceae bacterium]
MATIGSTNIDTRSFLHNNEINVAVFGDEFANAMEKAFDEDLRYSVEITKEAWEQRPFGNRYKEWIARRFEYLL